jgi:hypothetical protein
MSVQSGIRFFVPCRVVGDMIRARHMTFCALAIPSYISEKLYYMNKLFINLFFVVLLAGWGCKEKSHDHEMHHHDTVEGLDVSENQMLYNEVMKVHDEVMPKLEDIYKKKEALKNKIASTPNMPDAEKKKIEVRISQLDSAAESMMVWMREFNPLPDSTGEEKAREYLENQMERVKTVRENILNALKDTE